MFKQSHKDNMDMEIYTTNNTEDFDDYEDYEEVVGSKTRKTSDTPEQLRTRAGELQIELDNCKTRFAALELRIKKLGGAIGFLVGILFLVLIGALIFFMTKISEHDTKISGYDTKLSEYDRKISPHGIVLATSTASPPTFVCESGVTSAELKIEGKLLKVPCEDGWIVMQKRGQFNYNESFYRTFAEYEKGFGKIGAEFWMGLHNLASLTAEGNWQLRVDITDWDQQKYFSRYDSFRVGPGPLYVLRVSGYDKESNGGDSLTNPKEPEWAHNGMPFSTFDRDKDPSTVSNCAAQEKGGWWYNRCYQSNLNGINYGAKRRAVQGIIWEFDGARGDGFYTLMEATMKIKRKPDCIEESTRRFK